MPETTIPVNITFRKPGTNPPVFLASSASHPEWAPLEMQRVATDDGEQIFKSSIFVNPEREYLYKFRLGNEGSWTVDENSPTATDSSGNKTNILRASAGGHSEEEQQSTAPKKSFLAKLLRSDKSTAANEPVNRSSTPIAEVANTAAEVADTAAELDKEEPSPPPLTVLDMSSNDDGTRTIEEELKTPLFAHEAIGAYEVVDDGLNHDECDSSSKSHSRTVSLDNLVSEADLNDPTLERFPSDRTSVLNTLRQIQSSRSEDQVQIEETRRASVDSTDESLPSIPSLSPTSSRQRDSRLSHSSFGRSKSAVSLGAIAEEPKVGTGAGATSSKAQKM